MPELAPATLEGWYALHQSWATDWTAVRELGPDERRHLVEETQELWQTLTTPVDAGWSAPFRLVGGGADWMFVHFRPSLESLADVQRLLRESRLGGLLRLQWDYLSVTEAGLYHATAAAAEAHGADSDAFHAELAEAAAAELASTHVRSRLFPALPQGMPYVSFYPMSKRRQGEDNWYRLPIQERSRMMSYHGLIGRRYAGKIFQIISGSIGLDDWEWGVTLFGRDPLDFKRLVTEMRFDEASSRFGEFGSFSTGIRLAPDDWGTLLTGNL